MYSSNAFTSQSDMRQRINISGLKHLSNQQQASMPQLPSRQFMGMSQSPIQTSFGAYGGFFSRVVSQQQPLFSSPRVATTNCYPTGVFPHRQQQFYTPGRSQPAYPPGIAATNCFSPDVFPHQQQLAPQAQASGGQYSQEAFKAPAQGPRVAQSVVSTFAPSLQQVQQQQQEEKERDIFEYVDLTGDDEEQVQTAAPVAPEVPVPAAQETALPTPGDTPSPPKAPCAPEAPSHLRERVNHLKLTIHERTYPCAFRLLRSFEYMNLKQQRYYCALFWPSNEAAHQDIVRTAKLSLNFWEIYYRRISWHARAAEPMNNEECEEFDEEVEADCAEMERTCKTKLEDRRGEEDLSQLHQALTNTKGKRRNKAVKAAQLEVYRGEEERVQGEKRDRWARLNGKETSHHLAVAKRKRVDEEPASASASAPAPKKRGRPPKVRAVGEEGVVKETKKRGRPRKVPVVQEPSPDHTDEAGDDGALEAALLAGFSEDVENEEDDGSFAAAMLAEFAADNNDFVDAGVAVEPSGQLQEHEQESGVAAATADDLAAVCSEEAPASESATEVDNLPQKQGQEKEGCGGPATDVYDLDTLFEDDPVAAHVEESRGDVTMEDDDKDPLFDNSGSINHVEVDRLPQEQESREVADPSDPLADFLNFGFADDGAWTTDSFLNG